MVLTTAAAISSWAAGDTIARTIPRVAGALAQAEETPDHSLGPGSGVERLEGSNTARARGIGFGSLYGTIDMLKEGCD
jgi:hypothetical protein